MIPTSYEVKERDDGFYYRAPAYEEAAPWCGPHPTRKAAEAAVIETIKEATAAFVKSAFGFN